MCIILLLGGNVGIGITLTGIQKSGVLGGRDLVWISCG